MDLLKKIELRMEMLTQELERLPEEKVKIAQRVRICLFIVMEIIQCTGKGLQLYFYKENYCCSNSGLCPRNNCSK